MEASKGVALVAKDVWAAVSEIGDILGGRHVKASDAGDGPAGHG